MRTTAWALLLACSLSSVAICPGEEAERSLEVVATAYNSVQTQTNEEPRLAAWGDLLRDEMNAIAVSRDLLDLGLRRGTVVRIDGLQGDFVVLDKMNKRWTQRIDVYMGDDVEAARSFGRRAVTIRWGAAQPQTAVGAGPENADEPLSDIAEAEPR